MAILLALGSALVWGCADFMGGSTSRRQPVAAVMLVSQAVGFLALLTWLAASGFELDGRAVGLGLIAGLGGGIGLAFFYRALALGTMSIVSPITACGALVPLGLSLATGEHPAPLALAGALVALAGAVAASADERRSVEAARKRAVLLALGAAVTLGFFTYFLGLGGQHGAALSALVGARVGSLGVLAAWAVATRAPVRLARGAVPIVVLLGLLDTAANGLFVLATQRGFLAIVSVLGSLYPVATILAAHVLLNERISRLQLGGVMLALAGIALVASG